MAGQCCFRNSGNSLTVIPSTPELPLLALTRANACLQFSRSQTSSINRSPMARLSVPCFATSDSVPPARPFGASPLYSSSKANTSWFFCRLSLMSCAAYSPFPSTPCGDRSGLHRRHDYYALCQLLPPGQDRSLDPQSGFPDKRQISRGKFDRLPHATAGFTTSALDGYGLRCQLPTRPAPYASYPVLVHRLVLLLRASFRPHLAMTPLRFAMTSPPSGCQRDFHPRAVEHARHTTKSLAGIPTRP